MKSFVFRAVGLFAMLLIASFAHGQEADLLAQARALDDAGDYEAAIALYERIIEERGPTQEVVARLGIAQYHAGLHNDSLYNLNWSIDMRPFGQYWTESAFYHKAKLCSESGCDTDARSVIATMKSRYPDSTFTARVEVVETELNRGDVERAQIQLDRELEADALQDQANAASRAGHHEEALTLFNQVIQAYPDTRKSLRAMKIRALLLGLMHYPMEETLAYWNEILDEVGDAEHSALAYEARYRIAVLHQGMDLRQEAADLYMSLAAESQDPNMSAKAFWQGVGAQFEVYQRMIDRGETVTPAQWSQLRRLCRALARHPGGRQLFIVRAELMHLESYHWQGVYRLAREEAEEFVAKYDSDPEFLPDSATAHLILGECLQRERLHEEAMGHYQWIIDHCNGKEPWHGIETLARTRFRIFATLCRTDADAARIRDAAEYVLIHHGNTEYADLVRNAALQGFWTP